MIFAFCSLCSFSQGITGRVLAGENEPVEGATVVLQSSDSLFIDAVMTDATGVFLFEQQEANFRLIVQHMAFRTFEGLFSEENVGDIRLSQADHSLEELVVSAERPLVRVEDGKLSYDIRELVKDKVANNAYEALTKLPGVSEKENALSLVGAASLSVIINGKPSTMNSEQVGILLKSLPVERVEKVEVMYSAPPQYHVRGAVINIVLEKSVQYTFQGEVGATYRNKYYNECESHAFLRLSTPRHAFDFMYSINHASDVQDLDMHSLHTLYDTLYNIRQMQEVRGRAWLHNTRFSYEFTFNDNCNLSLAYNGMFKSDGEAVSKSSGNFQNSVNIKEIDKDVMHNLSMHAVLGKGISAGADYTVYDGRNTQLMGVDYVGGESLSLRQKAGQKVESLHAYADVSHPLGGGWNLGYGATYRGSRSEDFQHYLAGSTMGGEDMNSTLNEHTAEGYLSLGFQSAAGLSLSLSATAEFYKVNGRERWTLYPQGSLTFMRNPDHIWQATLQVSKLYPSYWQLQDAVSYIDGYSELHNSSSLEPSKRYSLNANYIFKQKYVLGAFMNYTHKMFAQAMYQSTGRLALIYQTHNWDYMMQTGLMAVVPFNPVERLNSRATLVGVYVSQKCDDFFDIGFEDRSLIGLFSLDNSFRLNKELAFELNGFFQTPATQGTFSIDEMWSLSAGVKWNFAGGKGTASCFLNDIFNSTIGDMRMNYKGQNLLNRNDFHTRSLTLSLVYRFGGYRKQENRAVDTSRFGH